MYKETILLIEDDPDEIELALLGFKKVTGDYAIQVATDGEEALDYLFATGEYRDRTEEQKPDLIILDLDLPKVSGFEVLKRIRDAEAYRYTPVVILTTSDEHSDILRGYNLGVNSYLCKPVDFDCFSDLLQQIIQYWLKTNTRIH